MCSHNDIVWFLIACRSRPQQIVTRTTLRKWSATARCAVVHGKRRPAGAGAGVGGANVWHISLPFSIWGTAYARHITTCPPPGFQTFLQPCIASLSCTWPKLCFVRLGEVTCCQIDNVKRLEEVWTLSKNKLHICLSF